MHRNPLFLSALVVVAVATACGTPSPNPTDGGGTGTGGTTGGAGGMAGSPATDGGAVVGLFQVLHSLADFGNSSSVFGKVNDGPTPPVKTFTVDSRDGDCRLEIPKVSFCATPCGSTAVCVADGVCQSYPRSRSVGAVRLSGVRAGDPVATTTVDLTAINNNYSSDVSLALPPFTDGVPMMVTAAGSADVPAFSISAKGIAPIALNANRYTFAANMPLALVWTAGTANPDARIEIDVDISHHGGLKGQIICDTADDGSLTIPATMVTKLINLGVAGFPSVQIRRIATSSTSAPGGKIEFRVISSVEKPLDIPGLVSCTDNMGCPSGQTCQQDLRCM
jgi:hypothetical protein